MRTAKQIARLDRIIGRIVIDPTSWEQETYGRKTSCGTAFCVAGHAVVDAKIPFEFVKRDWLEYPVMSLTDPERSADIEFNAREYLGLSKKQGDEIFDGDNTLEDILAAIRKIEKKEAKKIRQKALKKAAKAARVPGDQIADFDELEADDVYDLTGPHY